MTFLAGGNVYEAGLAFGVFLALIARLVWQEMLLPATRQQGKLYIQMLGLEVLTNKLCQLKKGRPLAKQKETTN